MKYLVVFSALLSLGCCQINLNAYSFSAVLREDGSGNPLYTLHWNFSSAEQTITFAVNVLTNGWVGFGISPDGVMPNSDIVIGWVNDDGQVNLTDRFAFARSRPPIDPQQDWIILNGENTNGYTVMEFWRKWVTSDDESDRDILVDTSHRVVYAWGGNDPQTDSEIVHHGSINRGAASLNLLSGVTIPTAEPTAESTAESTAEPTAEPTAESTAEPTDGATLLIGNLVTLLGLVAITMLLLSQ